MAKTDGLRSPPDVGRKRSKTFKPGETMPVTFRLDAELANALDVEAKRLTEEMGFEVSRVDVMRQWLKEAAANRSSKK